jgi:hypothetical protein
MAITDIPTRSSADPNASADINTLNSNDADLGNNTPDGFRNYIIDGDFNQWNENTSFSATGYTADMWTYSSRGTTSTVSREINIDSDVENYFMKIDVTASSAANVQIEQKLKDVSLLAGKNISVFMRLKSDTGLTNFLVSINRYDGSSGNFTNSTIGAIPSDDTWAWYRADVTVPDTSGLTITSGNYTSVILRNSTNELFTLDIDKVRVIETPENLQDDEIPEWVKKDQDNGIEQMKVRQYYYRSNNSLTGNNNLWMFTAVNVAFAFGGRDFPQPMITSPTITLYDSAGTANSVDDKTASTQTGATVNDLDGNEKGFSGITKTSAFTAGNIYGCHIEADARY